MLQPWLQAWHTVCTGSGRRTVNLSMATTHIDLK
jgi:hypothetical protein